MLHTSLAAFFIPGFALAGSPFSIISPLHFKFCYILAEHLPIILDSWAPTVGLVLSLLGLDLDRVILP